MGSFCAINEPVLTMGTPAIVSVVTEGRTMEGDFRRTASSEGGVVLTEGGVAVAVVSPRSVGWDGGVAPGGTIPYRSILSL